jgi:hypothetical protein
MDILRIFFEALPLVAALFVFYARMEIIRKEVQPNGGNSLKDRVVKLECTNADQLDRLIKIESRSEANHDQLSEIIGMLKVKP